MLDLTPPEEQLIQRSTLRFGEALTKFLLTGLGEVKTVTSVTFQFETEEPYPLRLKLATHSPAGLPKGREPMVLLYLLNDVEPKEWADDEIVKASVFEIHDTLEWDFNDETSELICSAILSYFDTSFELIRDEEEHFFKGATGFPSIIKRLVISYDLVFDEYEGGPKKLSFASIDMPGGLVRDLFNRNFMNIAWNETVSYEQQS